MGERVGVRELRQNLSKYLDRVKAGEGLIVTEHGREVARLEPIEADPYDVFVREFGATRPTETFANAIAGLGPREPHPAGTTDAILAEGRDR